MSWMKRLCETYDNNTDFIADYSQPYPLCPLCHAITTSQIEVTISVQGEFRGAKQDNIKIIIPVTEESAGRAGSTIAPHGLSDQLSYIAGDFKEYLEDSKGQKANEERFSRYLKEVERWITSSYSDPKVFAVYAYLSKGSLTKDLIDAGILECKEDGKIPQAKYEKNIVRFIIHGTAQPVEAWKSKTLIKQYQDYYMERRKYDCQQDICYLTGEKRMVTANHPKVSGNAKLISSNDMADYTFRGRFIDPEEAFAISYEASQKAHNALQWLIAKQGYNIGGQSRRTYVCWTPAGKEVPSVILLPGMIPAEEESAGTKEAYRLRIKRALNGFRENLRDEEIIIMSLEAATSGRLSITYYSELTASDFLDRIENWCETCAWEFVTFDAGKRPKREILTPLTDKIVDYAFGTQQGEWVNVNEKVKITQYQRLLSCIVDKQPLPKDILSAICKNASKPLNYSVGNRTRILSTACALLSKYYNDQNKGVKIEMELDKTNNDRSYLFGRLLAVYEKIELNTFYHKDEKRETNAIRMQSSYVQHPSKMRVILEDRLRPYFGKLEPYIRDYYKNLIGEITLLFKEEDLPLMNKGLDDLYLIGYYLQRAELNKKKDNEEKGEK